jgi:hypothetical protein
VQEALANEALNELRQRYALAEEKYAYFLLAVAASAVAFSVQKTETAVLTWTLIPMALAMLAWGGSFCFGCQHLIWAQNTMASNVNLLKGLKGNDPAAIQGAQEALFSDINNANRCKRWQFCLLILGAVFFLIWHIIGIVHRTSA